MTNNSLYTLILSTLAVAGLIVLIALGKITWGDGGPLIAAIIGVHGGASVAIGATSAAPAPTPTAAPTVGDAIRAHVTQAPPPGTQAPVA